MKLQQFTSQARAAGPGNLRRAALLPVVLALLAGALSAQSADPAAGILPMLSPAPPPMSASGVGSVHAVDFVPGSGLCGNNAGQSIGWKFDVLVQVTVVSMTWFDDNQDGLALSHEVAIWDPSGTIIPATQVVIPAGTPPPPSGICRPAAIAPTTLPPGGASTAAGSNARPPGGWTLSVSRPAIPVFR